MSFQPIEWMTSRLFSQANNFWLFANEAAGNAAEAGAGGEGGAPGDQPVDFFQQVLTSPFLLGGGLLALFYVMVLLPEKRKKAKVAERLSALKANQRIVTIGGIHGVIVSAAADSDVVTIKTDEGSGNRMKINRSAIATVLEDEKSGSKKDS
ncbi:preprotein translocase subunit YajC [Roseimaritima multifibrata]|uniref:Sec translocon accessory complex subunit YajC n=1 Tax=Roseimaritima multifibrata TaxID=1930274 RepID=A0A517MK49_9BACT|nr:preprotein translocase subunit YajC [Roseimaritima multifibrata]QDS95266.1 preprotein translocase subunit YajC [Roseimaritima multifibrata]